MKSNAILSIDTMFKIAGFGKAYTKPAVLEELVS